MVFDLETIALSKSSSEKKKSVLAGNLNSGLTYLITTVKSNYLIKDKIFKWKYGQDKIK